MIQVNTDAQELTQDGLGLIVVTIIVFILCMIIAPFMFAAMINPKGKKMFLAEFRK